MSHTAKKKVLELTNEEEDWLRNKPKPYRERLREKLEKMKSKRKKKASPVRVADRFLTSCRSESSG